MKKLFSTLAMLGALSLGVAAHGAVPPPSPPPIDWVPGQLPATRNAVVGMDCRVNAQRRIEDCKVTYEPLPGIGAAALRDLASLSVTLPQATPNFRTSYSWFAPMTAAQIASDPLNPTPAEVQQGYPAILCAQGEGCTPLAHYTNRAVSWGDFAMDCELTPAGQLIACQMTSEATAGLSATPAAQNLVNAPSARLQRGIIGPVNVRFAIPLTPEQAAAASRNRPIVYGSQDWAQRPTSSQIESVYPASARQKGLPGTAMLNCNVTAAGALTGCAVVAETPRGEGFGAAALELTKFMRMRPRTENGVAIAGTVRIPINFSPP